MLLHMVHCHTMGPCPRTIPPITLLWTPLLHRHWPNRILPARLMMHLTRHLSFCAPRRLIALGRGYGHAQRTIIAKCWAGGCCMPLCLSGPTRWRSGVAHLPWRAAGMRPVPQLAVDASCTRPIPTSSWSARLHGRSCAGCGTFGPLWLVQHHLMMPWCCWGIISLLGRPIQEPGLDSSFGPSCASPCCIRSGALGARRCLPSSAHHQRWSGGVFRI